MVGEKCGVGTIPPFLFLSFVSAARMSPPPPTRKSGPISDACSRALEKILLFPRCFDAVSRGKAKDVFNLTGQNKYSCDRTGF